MLKTNKRAAKLSALVLAFALVSLSVVPAWAAPQLSGKLLTTNSLPVLVNGNSANSGATITSGTLIATPDTVSATIQIPGLGEVELAPGSIATLEFSNGMLKVTLKKGCVISRGNVNTRSSVVDETGKTLPITGSNTNPAMSDGKSLSNLPACAGGVLMASSAGGAAATGAATGAGGAAPAGAGAGAAVGGGLSAAAIGAIVAAVVSPLAIIGIVRTGDDPSPSN